MSSGRIHGNPEAKLTVSWHLGHVYRDTFKSQSWPLCVNVTRLCPTSSWFVTQSESGPLTSQSGVLTLSSEPDANRFVSSSRRRIPAHLSKVTVPTDLSE